MTTDNYDPSIALSPYFPSRERRNANARLWAVEKALLDLAHVGIIGYFVGPAGSDPTQLSGYATTKLWLKQSPGVQEAPGTVHYWNNTAPASDEANWPQVTPDVPIVGAASAAAAATSAAAAAVSAAAATRTTPKRKTGSHILEIEDRAATIEMSVGAANTLTVPPESSVAFDLGDFVNVVQYGAGATTIVAGSGVTIRSRLGLVLGGRYAMGTLYKSAADEWIAGGDLISA